MATGERTSFYIEPLDGTNYDLWNARMRNVLIYRKLFSAIDGSDSERTEHTREVKAYILLNVKPEIAALVDRTDYRTAKDVWDELKRIYQTSSNAQMYVLYNSLGNLELLTDESIVTYVGRATQIKNALIACGAGPPDVLVILSILNGLPSEYKTASAMLTGHNGTTNINEVMSALLQEEQAIKHYKTKQYEKETTEKALFAKQQFSSGPSKWKGKYNGTKFGGNGSRDEDDTQSHKYFSGKCFICDKPGHKAHECWHKKKFDREREDGEGKEPSGHSANKVTFAL